MLLNELIWPFDSVSRMVGEADMLRQNFQHAIFLLVVTHEVGAELMS